MSKIVNSVRPPKWLLAVVAVVASLTVSAQTDAFTSTIDGAVRLARQKLSENKRDAVGKELLEFVLALAPNNEEALLLLSSVEESLPIAPPKEKIVDGGTTYATFIAELGDQFLQLKDPKIQTRGLLFMSLAKDIDPENRTARLTLIKAKRAGRETDFAPLLAIYQGKDTGTGGTGGTGGTATAPDRPAEPVRAAADPATDDTRKLLDTLRLDSYYTYPSSAVNTLNRTLAPYNISIIIAAKNVTATVSTSGYSYPYYNSITYQQVPNMRETNSSSYRNNITMTDALRDLCRKMRTSYKIEGKRITITDADDPAAADDIGFQMTCTELLQEFNSNASKASMKFKGKPIELVGTVSNVGRAIGGKRVISLEDGKIQATFDNLSEAEIARLERDFEQAEKYNKSNSQYSNYRYVITAQFSGTCSSQRLSRLTIDDAKGLTWRSENRYNK